MAPWLITLMALVSTGICIWLWFRDVRRIMTERKSTLESAACQLKCYRGKARQGPNDPETMAILARSESIYHQAVDRYNRTLRKPWNYLPGRLMGFRFVS